MKKLLLFATTMLLAFSSVETIVAKEIANSKESTVEATAVASPRVYSNCYDGYLNVRAQPTSKSQILARLNNGSEGAELLGVEGNWSKVRVNGVVGYVSSKYLQSTPTDPVYIDASAVVGEWLGDCSGVLKIKSNGKFEHTFGFSPTMSYTEGGTWHLSHKNVVLKYSNGTVVICYVDGQTMSSDEDETFSRL
jgi:hypothetical protein